MRVHISVFVSEWDHPLVSREADDDGEPYVVTKLSETMSIQGDEDHMTRFIREMAAQIAQLD